MQILDKQFFADNVVYLYGRRFSSVDYRDKLLRIQGNVEAIEKEFPFYLEFTCAGCGKSKSEGLQFHTGVSICTDCMTEPYDSMTGIFNDSIKLVSGHYISLKNPDPDLIFMEDISSGVSNISRYSGQLDVEHWYSVAEHLLNCFDVAKELGYTKEQQRHVLMHDATEAYLGDMSKPLKRMMPMFKWFEGKMEKAIEARFNLDFKRHHDAIKFIDNALLLAERFAIYGDDGVEWQDQDSIYTVKIEPRFLKPMDIKVEFLEAWESVN